MASASDVAEFYIAMFGDSEESMTDFRIGVLLYLAQGWCVARLGRPLFEDDIVACEQGPAIPGVHGTYGHDPAERIGRRDYIEPFSADEVDLLVDVAMEYGGLSESELASVSKAEGSPWAEIYDPDWPGRAIPIGAMRRHFSSMPPLRRHSVSPDIERCSSPFPDGRVVLPAEYDDPADLGRWTSINRSSRSGPCPSESCPATPIGTVRRFFRPGLLEQPVQQGLVGGEDNLAFHLVPSFPLVPLERLPHVRHGLGRVQDQVLVE